MTPVLLIGGFVVLALLLVIWLRWLDKDGLSKATYQRTHRSGSADSDFVGDLLDAVIDVLDD